MTEHAFSLTDQGLWARFCRKAMKLLMVSVGSGHYAVAADAVVQIFDPALERGFVPDGGSGEIVRAGARHRVAALPAARTRPAGTGSRLYLVLDEKTGRCVLPIDSAEAIQEVPGTAIAPLPSFIFAGERRPFRGIFFDGRGPRLLLDVGALA